jgi:hypothetical protein
MIATYKVEDLTFDLHTLYLKVDGKTYKISLQKTSDKLVNANAIERGLYKVSPSGYGIHWPLLDEDLSVEWLIKLAE